MIFAHTLDKVICGEKSQTRRLVKSGESLDSTGNRVTLRNNRTLYEIGKTYAVQPNRGKKAVARIRLTAVRREPVAVISEKDARAEGFTSSEEFLTTWRSIHGQSADLQQEVWVLEFELHTVHTDEFKVLYGHRTPTNRSLDNGYDISSTLTGVSGISLHSGDHPIRGAAKTVSGRLPLPSTGTTISQVSVDTNRPGAKGGRKRPTQRKQKAQSGKH